jgi:group I intron endonuclease
MIIYQITNTKNGKTYVGQHCGSKDSRWKQHLKAGLNVENPLPLYRAMRKYGQGNFQYEVLEEIPLSKGPQFLDEREKFWIKQKRSLVSENGYNLTLCGQGVMTHYCSAERAQKLSNKLDKKNYGQYNPTTGELIKIWDKGADLMSELGIYSTHARYSSDWLKGNGKYGKTAGGFLWLVLDNEEEFPKKVTPVGGKGNYGRKKVGKSLSKEDDNEIAQYSLSGLLIDVFPNNTREVERLTGIRASSVGNAIKEKTRVGSGYQWRVFPKGKSPDKIDSELIKSQLQFSKRELTTKPVIKTFDDRELFTYKSVVDAVLDSNSKPTDIMISIQNNTEDPDGFIWKWKS